MVGGDGVERQVEHQPAGLAGAGEGVGELLQRRRAGGLGGDAGDRGGGQARGVMGRGWGADVPRAERRRVRIGQGGEAAAGHQAVSLAGAGVGGGLLLVAAPGGDEQPLEGGIGLVEGLAAAGVGLAVEVAVVGLVDAAGLLAGLADQRGEVLAPGGEARPSQAVISAGELGLLARGRSG